MGRTILNTHDSERLLREIFNGDKKVGKYKVQGGTAQTEEDLCKSCSNRILVKGFNNSEMKLCRAIDFIGIKGWPVEVSECSHYTKAGETSLWDMRQIAWHVTPEVKNKIGFEHGETKLKVVTPNDKDKEGKKRHHWRDDGLDNIPGLDDD
jgi:hypothetical protein